MSRTVVSQPNGNFFPKNGSDPNEYVLGPSLQTCRSESTPGWDSEGRFRCPAFFQSIGTEMIATKMIATAVATAAALPSLMSAFAQVTTEQPNLWELGRDMGFAGLVYYLVAYQIPKLLESHHKERVEDRTIFLDQLAKEREAREKSIRDGHEVARAMSAECHSVQREATAAIIESRQAIERNTDLFDRMSRQ